MPPQEERGQAIVEAGNQIHRLDDAHYHVNSQSSDRVYEVATTRRGWTCSCVDHQAHNTYCKHIHAIEISRNMRRAIQETVTATPTVIRQIDLGRCKRCDSPKIVKQGFRYLKKGTFQGFKCKDCGKRFTHNLGFEGKRATPDQIATAVELVFSGLSTRKTATILKSMGVKVSYQTVLNWATEYARLMERFMDNVTPNVGETWRTDEVYMTIKGNRRYLFAILDGETRFWIAKMVAEHKGNDDVAPIFAKAKKVAGKVPKILISDKASNYHHAWKQQYRAKNFMQKETVHINEVAFDGIHHNNQMESFNGNTIRFREGVIRGFKKENSALLSGLRTYHNFVRPHQGLSGGMTPGEAAGITIEGDNKILTIIQAAAKSFNRFGSYPRY